MPRRTWAAFPLGFLCLLLGACGHFRSERSVSPGELPAILVSIPADAVYLVQPSGAERRTVATRLSDFQGGYARWDQAHRRLAYGDGGVVLFDPRTNREEGLIRGRSLSMPAWSPDGRSLAYGDGRSLWLSGVANPKPRRLRVPAVLAPLEMAWGSSGVIAFEGLRLDCSRLVRCTSTGFSEIWTILPDGTGLTRVSSVGHAEKPNWSPDGLRLLFIRTYSADGRRSELWTAQADGSGARRILSVADVIAADWSPDGARLAVVRRGQAPRTLQLWIGRADGTGLRPAGEPLRGTDATIDW